MLMSHRPSVRSRAFSSARPTVVGWSNTSVIRSDAVLTPDCCIDESMCLPYRIPEDSRRAQHTADAVTMA